MIKNERINLFPFSNAMNKVRIDCVSVYRLKSKQTQTDIKTIFGFSFRFAYRIFADREKENYVIVWCCISI